MRVLNIRHKARNVLVGIVELPSDVTPATAIKHFLSIHGLTENAAAELDFTVVDVIPWSDLKDVFTPIHYPEDSVLGF